jgi:hypothetical protein
MPFFDSTVDQAIRDQFANALLSLTSPKSTISEGGGALLRRFSPPAANPRIETLGIVLSSPNVPRAFHTGFDPAVEPDRYENDFMDKLVFVSQADYDADPGNGRIVDVMSAGNMFFGRMVDTDGACGCSPSSHGTPVFRLIFGDAITFEPLPDLYVVVAAKFVDDPSQGAVGPMTASEYWIATHENRNLILNSPEYAAARVRSRKSSPPDCLGRRDRVRKQIDRLRRAKDDDIIHLPPAV